MNLFEQHLRLSDLATLIDQTLYSKFGPNTFWVKAETSDIKNYFDRQYCFLTLVEKENNQIVAKMDAVIWRQQYHIIREFSKATGVSFDKNINLLMRVQVGFSAQYGLRLQILELDTGFTIGALEMQRQATLLQLVEKNPKSISFVNGEYTTLNKKLFLPQVMQKVALITAPGSDGERDFKHELQNNTYSYKFQIDSFLTQIQGKDADKAILAQLNLILELGKKYDVVAIVRGGGSQLDFSAFDNYELGLKIATFPIPIIAGIGHERNVSIADLMCFSSLKTPTKAAAFMIDHNHFFEQQIDRLKSRLVFVADGIIQSSKSKLEKTTLALKNASMLYFKEKHNALIQKSIAIKLLDPSHVLARGFAILNNENGIIMDAQKLKKGDKITATTKDAVVRLVTDEVMKKV
ncbi:MAG TPA: exodeoxyribonuclease VII large subunit [Bacteroidia bacterium]|nr:exodeoxyribonuclease VII large subunit [Bacteroidia bacterium]